MSWNTTPDTQHTALWDALVATALVGTERRAAALPNFAGPVDTLLAQLNQADAEGALLGAAAIMALYRRAGQLPAPGSSMAAFPSCDLDDLPVCSAGAAQHLALMLGGKYREALAEWLTVLAATGKRAPDIYLTTLLGIGRGQPNLRPTILPVLGKRGRWLATQNPEWNYASYELQTPGPELSLEQLSTIWETGRRAVRLALLQQLRATNPALARNLVATTWATEKADDRATFLATFAEGLSMDDEPFLEAALDDRSKEVRATAADLLSSVAESRLVQRTVARVLPLLTWAGAKPQQPGDRQARIDVTLPEACDKAMIRDGVEPKSRDPKMGEKAWWLSQMLAVIPPAVWRREWNAVPEELLQATMPREWRGLLLRSWAAAAQRHHDLDWIEALLSVAGPTARDLSIEGLISLLPEPRQEALILELLERHPEPLGREHPAFGSLRQYDALWSHTFARAVLDSLRRRFADLNEKEARTDWYLRAAIEEFALRIPSELTTEVATVFGDNVREWPFWQATIATFEGLVRFRREMRRALVE